MPSIEPTYTTRPNDTSHDRWPKRNMRAQGPPTTTKQAAQLRPCHGKASHIDVTAHRRRALPTRLPQVPLHTPTSRDQLCGRIAAVWQQETHKKMLSTASGEACQAPLELLERPPSRKTLRLQTATIGLRTSPTMQAYDTEPSMSRPLQNPPRLCRRPASHHEALLGHRDSTRRT